MVDICDDRLFEKQEPKPDKAKTESVLSDLLPEEIHIVLMQRKIKAQGWQWEEHIFNDGKGREAECVLELTLDTNPCHFLDNPSNVNGIGWGRFSRIHCWQQAYKWIMGHDFVYR